MQTCTVACKVPNGILIRFGTFHTVSQPVLGGGVRDIKEWHGTGETITINGPRRESFTGDRNSPIADGFALTHGVDHAAMAQWMIDNKQSEIVAKGMIRMHEKQMELKAMTKEAAGVVTGLEPINPAGDKRIPRSVSTVTKD